MYLVILSIHAVHNDYGVSYREGASVSGGKSFGGGGGGCGGAQSALVGYRERSRLYSGGWRRSRWQCARGCGVVWCGAVCKLKRIACV